MVSNVPTSRSNPWMIATIVLAVILVVGLGWALWMQSMCMQHCMNMNMNDMMQMAPSQRMPAMQGQRAGGK